MLSQGVLIGGPATLAVLVAAGVIIRSRAKRKRQDPSPRASRSSARTKKDGKALIWGGIGVLVLTLVIAATSYWPTRPRTTRGGRSRAWPSSTSRAASSPAGTKGVEQVRLQARHRRVRLPRHAPALPLIKKCDSVKLSCRRLAVSGTDGDDCNFVRRDPATARLTRLTERSNAHWRRASP